MTRNKKSEKTIWIAAGGTGGHISPAVSLSEKFISKDWQVIFFTLQKDLDYPDIRDLNNNKKIEFVAYPAPKLPKGIKSLIMFIKKMISCQRILNQWKTLYPPRFVLGLGGYPSFPLLFWAKRKKLPYFLAEQNAVYGRITKLMKKGAKLLFLSFPKENLQVNEIVTGNPIRKIFKKYKIKKASPKKSDIKKILMIGGSQGAKDMNRLFLEIIKDPFFDKFLITISTGQKEYSQLAKYSSKNRIIFDFIVDMPNELQKNNLIISRAGSGSVFEILWAKKPAVFLPYPFAVYNHQKENALAIKKEGLAECIDLHPFDSIYAKEQIKTLIESKKLFDMAEKLENHIFSLEAEEIIFSEIDKLST
ncbi:MAG: glycosyltransferase [Spirochaetia bacterium]|nr:glycosyltransferase [Spirochaetia bacterium]